MAGPRKDAANRVARWATANTRTAQLGRDMLAGEWRTAADAVAMGAAASVLSQTLTALREAGYVVEGELLGDGTRAMRYRVAEAPKARRGRAPKAEAAEVPGGTYPALGATLTVRALGLDEAGQLTMRLTNGHGAWTAHVVGHDGTP